MGSTVCPRPGAGNRHGGTTSRPICDGPSGALRPRWRRRPEDGSIGPGAGGVTCVAPTVAVAVALAAAGLTACGETARPVDVRVPAAPAMRAAGPASTPLPAGRRPPPGPSADDPGLPPNVPLRATGPARAADLLVVRRWLGALRRGDVASASGWLNLPTRYQNGGGVQMLTVPADRVTATLAMPCGPRLTSAGGFGAYVVATLRLEPRPGARCGSARRRVARLAIRVGHRRITELYRLPTDPRRQPVRTRPVRVVAPAGPAA